MLNNSSEVGLPHLNDYLSLEECIVVLNVSGIVLRERQAENKQREIQVIQRDTGSELDWIPLKDLYPRQLLRKSLLRPSSLIFKCSLYCINCWKYKGSQFNISVIKQKHYYFTLSFHLLTLLINENNEKYFKYSYIY